MKKTLLAALAALTITLTALGQATPPATNSPLQQAGNFLSPLLTATNWEVAPYLTYAPNVGPTAKTKIGGGILGIYNVSQNVGAGLGVDWLGGFNLVSANVTLKLPMKPLAFTGWSWATNLVATPFVIAGIGTPLAGSGTANGGISTIEGAGASIRVGTLWGGGVNLGGAYDNWTGAGDYSGRHLQIFVGWRKNF